MTLKNSLSAIAVAAAGGLAVLPVAAEPVDLDSVRDVFLHIDRNDDMQISRTEYVQFVKEIPAPEPSAAVSIRAIGDIDEEQEARTEFETLDHDGSGFVTLMELREGTNETTSYYEMRLVDSVSERVQDAMEEFDEQSSG